MNETRHDRPTDLIIICVATILLCAVVVALAGDRPASSVALGTQSLLLAILGVGLNSSIVVLRDGYWRPISLYSLFLYSHVVIFVLHPAYQLFLGSGRNIFDESPFSEIDIYVQILALLGLSAFTVGYVVLGPGRILPVPNTWILRETDATVIRKAVPFTIAGGLILYTVNILQIGPFAYFALLFQGRSAELSDALRAGSGYFQSGLLFLIGIGLLLFAIALRSGSRQRTIFSSGFLALLVLPQVASGSRSIFVPVILAMLLIVLYVRPALLRPTMIALMLPILFVVTIVAPRVYRVALSEGIPLSETLVSVLSAKSLLEDSLGGYDTAMYDAFRIQVEAQGSGALPLTLGSTYVNAMTAVIPRGLWSSKPPSVDQVLNAALFPRTWSQGVGFSFGVYSEPFLNFGPGGIVVVLALLGIAFGCLESVLRTSKTVGGLAIYALVAGGTFALVRGSISFDSQRIVITALPLIVLLLAARPQRRSGRFRAGTLSNRR